jgi:DNA-binding Lrp family transcriptional regulator
MADQLDQIDRHILFHLALDARRTSAPDITEQLDVSAATIRNRIKQLEERRVIQGYHANIDYEKTGGKLTYLFICGVDTPRREYFAREVLQVPGVIQVRELMSGRRNLHIEAVGEDKAEITRIARDLSNLGLEIEDEALVQRDYHHPYEPFGPESALSPSLSNLTNLRELAGDAKVIDVTVSESAPANGYRIGELSEEGLLEEGLLIVAIERGEEVIMPNGETQLREGDLVTVLTQHGEAENLAELFTGQDEAEDAPSAKSRNHEM